MIELSAAVRLWPPVFLAPMAGITDLPFRSIVGEFGAGLVVSEIVASQDMVLARPEACARAELGLGAANSAVQIAGREPHWMAECARMCEANGARIIDINMGCPAKKVTGGQSGSALMRTPDLALRLIEAVVGAVRVPVTVKMRLGWDHDHLNAPELAARAVAAGASAVTVHGRTRCQFYKGRADWAAVAHVVQAVPAPVIVNGDIVDAATAQMALAASGAAGVMIGRGAQGRPWLLAQVAAKLFGTPPPAVPAGRAFGDLVARHYERALSFHGVDLGVRTVRKHLGWYLDQTAVAPDLRREILTCRNPVRVLRLLSALEMRVPERRAA